ncbi:hypothetical protein [Acetobacter okinawensis]|uniref:hypothetical protein n=1 Tax=Acetobacter okinawensis TaxID=1076594 RepID=UPI0020A00CDD|nr:hypothetical protein [Acetobacter okinawensis]MCP1214146.1 hypothetical protein [Acetobacter okinawensis]
MKSTDDRKLFDTAIGSSAASGNIATIPQTQATAGDGTASLALGFPPETFIARAAGGEPPRGQDMNGLLNLLSSAMQVLQAGYLGPFNSDFAQGIGGYPAGAIVAGSTAGTFWVSTADANVSTPGATGATWQSLFNGYATQTWANGQFLQLASTATQAVTGPVTFSGTTIVPTPTDYTQKQAIGASDADARYARLEGGNTLTGVQTISGTSSTAALNLTNPTAFDGSTNRNSIHFRQSVGTVTADTFVQGASESGSSWAVVLTGASGQLAAMTFSAAGMIATTAGTVAFTSQLPHTTYSGTAGAAGSYTITTFTDTSTPSGKRYRISGQTAEYTAEGSQTISLPITLNGVLPGAWGATMFWPTKINNNNDQIAQITATPTVSTIQVNVDILGSVGTPTWPCYVTWFLEGY